MRHKMYHCMHLKAIDKTQQEFYSEFVKGVKICLIYCKDNKMSIAKRRDELGCIPHRVYLS